MLCNRTTREMRLASFLNGEYDAPHLLATPVAFLEEVEGMSLSPFAQSIFSRTYAMTPTETWEQCAQRVASAVANDAHQYDKFFAMIKDRKFIPGGRYLYSAGRGRFMNSNCYGFIVADSRESWSKLLHDVMLCLSTGGGLGVNYSGLRGKGSPIKTMGGEASGPIALMQMVNEVARHVMSGGKRRSALWAGLNWNHPDINEFIAVKNWSDDIKAMKAKNFEYPAPLDMTNISVIVGSAYLNGLTQFDPETWQLHQKIVAHMARTGEPAFRNQDRILQDDDQAMTGNACQESTLHDRDTCNLGSIVLPRVRSLDELEELTVYATQFLYNGSIKGNYPTDEIERVARRNRRLGLGIMGLHEFMIMHHGRYEWFRMLESWIQTWAGVSREEGDRYANKLSGNRPITLRAIAPTGTISIIGETTSGIEPIYCVAYKRRYINGDKHLFQYVIDPTAKRLLDLGFHAKDIEDAYSLAHDVERRIALQANMQDYVDQAISSTINLPEFGTKNNDNPTGLALTIAKYLPRLKGLTVYPDGARSGQPLTPVTLEEAYGQEGVVFEEEGDRCSQGVCGL